MTRWSREGMLVAAVVLSATAACGPTDQGPLGGPYGGTSVPPPPTEGNSGSSSGSAHAAAASDGGAPAAATSDGGSAGHAQAEGGSGGGAEAGGAAPTWSALYTEYLATGTEGNCQGCHAGQMGSASASYAFLQGKGYISGTGSSLVKNSSCLSWFGGNMPPGGPSDATAAAAMSAWVAAGAQND
jgi:hypothetical protein